MNSPRVTLAKMQCCIPKTEKVFGHGVYLGLLMLDTVASVFLVSARAAEQGPVFLLLEQVKTK